MPGLLAGSVVLAPIVVLKRDPLLLDELGGIKAFCSVNVYLIRDVISLRFLLELFSNCGSDIVVRH
jgi:hypothetical protein